MKTRRPLAALLASVVLATSVAACSSGDNGVARGDSRTGASEAAPATTETAESESPPPSSEESAPPSSEESDPTTEAPFPSSEAPEDTSTPPDVSPLVDAGIQIVQSEEEPGNGQPLRLTTIQADRLAAETDPAAGVLGSDLDALAPVPEGVPPTSYLLAAWISAGTSAGAETARGWMGEQDWTQAPGLQYPLAAVAMFVNEMAMDTSQLPPGTDSGPADTLPPPESGPPQGGTGSGFAGAGYAGRSLALPAAPCSAVTGFLSSVISGLFDALKITPSTNGDGGILDTVTSVLATAWNVALGLAQGAVEGLIKNLTAPIFNAIRVAVGALGVATTVISYFKDQTLDVTLEAPQASEDQYPFAVGGGPDVNGKFVAKGRELTGDWPAALIDCANVAGAKLPQLIKPGSPANWEVDGNNLIVPGPLMGEVSSDNTASLTFVTGRESEDDAKGEATYGIAYATVKIPRKEVEEFLALAKAQVDGVKGQLLSAVPPAARDAVSGLLAATVDPTVKQISDQIAGAVGGPLAVQGTGKVVVLHHKPPDTTTIPEPSTPPDDDNDDDGDFCTQYQALADWTFANAGIDFAAFGAEAARRLTEMRPSAPDELLGAVDTELDVYTTLAASGDVLVLQDKAEALGAAAAVLGNYCGIVPRG
jgi:hypothetical protein